MNQVLIFLLFLTSLVFSLIAIQKPQSDRTFYLKIEVQYVK